jgi:anti-sigma B factor antagonist
MSGYGAATLRPLAIETERRGDTAIVHLAGGATMEQADRLRDALMQVIGRSGACIVLDVQELEFISSLGLGIIVAAHLQTKQRGGSFRVAGAKSKVGEVLALTKLTRLFDLFDSVEDALRGSH